MLKDYFDNEIKIGNEVIIMETKVKDFITCKVKSVADKTVLVEYTNSAGEIKTTRRYGNRVINKTQIGCTMLSSFQGGKNTVIGIVELLTKEMGSGAGVWYQLMSQKEQDLLARIFNIRDYISKLDKKMMDECTKT